MNIQHTITGHPLLNGVLWLVADEDWGEAKGELGRVKWRKSRWRLFIKCDLVGRYASSNSFLRESKFGWLVRVVCRVVRGLVRRVVRGVVRRVVGGVGSVGSPRTGGQFFQLFRIDVYAILPTAFGKNLIFQLFPWIKGALEWMNEFLSLDSYFLCHVHSEIMF